MAKLVACMVALALVAATPLSLASCSDAGDGLPSTATSNPDSIDAGTTSGPAFELGSPATATFNQEAAFEENGAFIDTSSVAQGFVAASAVNESRLKFQVTQGEMSYNYDLPGDGEPIVCPLNMGDGAYEFRVMQNTRGNSYVPIATVDSNVTLESEFAPFLRPNVFCQYDADSACVQKARELAEGATNEGDVLRAVYTWIAQNVSYDTEKAERLADATGYLPNPDATLAEKTGICFDYVSLGAAMLRSLGIPTKIVTGYVSPDNIYHAWNLVYLDGTWKSVQVSVDANTWTRIDLTFAAAGANEHVGDAKDYTDRYTY